MDYYRIWNELRMNQSELYVLEIKLRSNEITHQEIERKVELEKRIDYWNTVEEHWNKYGVEGFDVNGNMRVME